MNCPNCRQELQNAPQMLLTSDRRHGKSIEYRQCKECDIWFQHPLRTQRELDVWYSSGDYRRHVRLGPPAPTPAERNSARERARDQWAWMEPIWNKVGTILDVGAFAGDFVDLVQGAGYQAIGYDLDGYAAAVSEGRVLCGGTYKLPAWDFELITMSHVLEHVAHPQDFLNFWIRASRLKWKRKTTRYWFAEVPHPGFGWPHPLVYTMESLTKIARKAGFQETEKMEEVPNAFRVLFRGVI